MWRPACLPVCVPTADSLRIELLQLSTLLIDTASSELMEHRKELIKFAWHHLKSEDLVTKNWAYVNVCRFIEVRSHALRLRRCDWWTMPWQSVKC